MTFSVINTSILAGLLHQNPIRLCLAHWPRNISYQACFLTDLQAFCSFQLFVEPTRYACGAFDACCGFTFFPSLLYRTRGGGARLRRPSRERTLRHNPSAGDPKGGGTPLSRLLHHEGSGRRTYLTILPWMAQLTQYWSLRYILGTA